MTFQTDFTIYGSAGNLNTVDSVNWSAVTLAAGFVTQVSAALHVATASSACIYQTLQNTGAWTFAQWSEVTFQNAIAGAVQEGPMCLTSSSGGNNGYFILLHSTTWQFGKYVAGGYAAIGAAQSYSPATGAGGAVGLEVSGSAGSVTLKCVIGGGYQSYTQTDTSSLATTPPGMWAYNGSAGNGDISTWRGDNGTYVAPSGGGNKSLTVTQATLAVAGQSIDGVQTGNWTEASLTLTGQNIGMSVPLTLTVTNAVLNLTGQGIQLPYGNFFLNAQPATLAVSGQIVTLTTSGNPTYINWNDPVGVPLQDISGFQVGIRPAGTKVGVYPVLLPMAFPTDRRQLIPPLLPGVYYASVMTFTYSAGASGWTLPEVQFILTGVSPPASVSADSNGVITWAASVSAGVSGYLVGIRSLAPFSPGAVGSYPITLPVTPGLTATLPANLSAGSYAVSVMAQAYSVTNSLWSTECVTVVTIEQPPSTVTVS